MKKLLISIVLLNFLAACASEKPKEPIVAAPVTAAPEPVVAVDALDDPSNILSKRSVHFPFDVSSVQDSDKPVVQAHAKYLSSNPDRKVRLEGNADERGSNEYNLALGQRRADSVKKMLVLGGANAKQISTISYGEEKALCSDHQESCWGQNRRTDIKY